VSWKKLAIAFDTDETIASVAEEVVTKWLPSSMPIS
jgi:hypothetical protein